MTKIHESIVALEADLPAIADLLKENHLPTEDLGKADQQFWLIRDEKKLLAVIGIEKYGDSGLLRSMATSKEMRNQGLAGQLLETLLSHAKRSGFKDIYLLTTTAEKFFSNKGFEKIERNSAPDEIKKCSEFSHLCPSTAVVMKRSLQ